MRIYDHPILGMINKKRKVNITIDGRQIVAFQGDTISGAMHANGMRVTGEHPKHKKGVYCGIGQCTDCVMVVNGVSNTRVCVTEVEDGMIILSQDFGIRRESK